MNDKELEKLENELLELNQSLNESLQNIRDITYLLFGCSSEELERRLKNGQANLKTEIE